MTIPFTHGFDEEAYRREHPELRAALDAGEYETAYQHFICSSPVGSRYTNTGLEPTVTIVVPSYNCERWLAYTLESVLHQTYNRWECIVVDDGSTDGTSNIIKRYLAEDQRFRRITHRANGGLSAARNSGIRSARGSYIAFLDSDDLMMESSVTNRLRVLRAADSERLAGSYCASMTISEGRKVPPAAGTREDMEVVDFITASGRCPFNANQPMFKTEVLRRVGGFDERLRQAEDWELWLRLLRHGYFLLPTHTVDVTYRTRSTSMIRSNPMLHLETALAIYESAHSTLPASKTFEGTPFVYKKPWIAYKKQLDTSRRVLEFYGMALTSGTLNGTQLPARTLPDFFDAIAPHEDITAALKAGVARQAFGRKNKWSEYGSRLLVAKCLESFRAIERDDDADVVVGSFPEDLGPTPGEHRAVDVVFLPQKDYHVWSLSLILEELDKRGITYTFVDAKVMSRDEGGKRKADELGLPSISYNEFLLGELRPKMVVCLNDWDPTNNRIVKACKRLGIATVGIVEGIQDYDDVDTGRVRRPYRSVEYVLLPGEFDKRYFESSPPDKVRVAGMSRVDELLKEECDFPEHPLVVINSNFSYNVLTEERDEWVRQAVEACEELGYDYLISRHPADKGDFSSYRVADESMYDLIRRGSVFLSRFGSGILESLAMGKPSLYFNPHGEKVDKFTEPNGAFPVSLTYDDLLRDLRATVEEPQRFLEHADDYVELHCGTSKNAERSASEKLASELVDIYEGATFPPAERRALLKYLLLDGDERLLGPVTMQRSSTRPKRGEVRANGPETAPRAWQRKVDKLRKNPKKFFADSRIGPLKLLKNLF